MIMQVTFLLIAFSGLAGWRYLALPLFDIAVAAIGAPFLGYSS